MPEFPRSGPALEADVRSLAFHPQPLIHEFLYKQLVMMLAADPGAGKSVVATQIALSVASGIPLFGVLPVEQPSKVYYLQLEGHYAEFIERIRYMQRDLQTINYGNLAWDTSAYLNVLKDTHADALLQRIQAWAIPDLIVLDPIYMAVSGGLSKDEPASAFARFSNRLRQTFGCAVLLVHHTHRAQYLNGQEVQEDDPFYGSQWLKAHVDIAYHLKVQNAEHSRVNLVCTKARGKNVHKVLALHYHPETFTCSLDYEAKSGDAMTRLISFASRCKSEGKVTDFYETASKIQVSHAHLRRLQGDTSFPLYFNVVKAGGKKHLWIPC